MTGGNRGLISAAKSHATKTTLQFVSLYFMHFRRTQPDPGRKAGREPDSALY